MSKTYEDGLNDAWEASRKIQRIAYWDLESVFGCKAKYIYNLSASEAIAKIKEYEENRTKNKVEIHVGDEIYSELTDSKAVVQRIDSWHRYQCFTDKGAQFVIDTETFNKSWVKTGKSYPQIAEVLKQMNEVKE